MKAYSWSLLEEFIKVSLGSQFVIPVYQRNYTWKKHKQVKKLLEDIRKVLDAPKMPKHFMGSIVYLITKTELIVREREVVDGQQRLITVFLIIHALKEIAVEREDKNTEELLKYSYLENYEKNKYHYRLRPSVSDDDAYLYIANNNVDEYKDKSLIMENYKYIKNTLCRYVDDYGMTNVLNAVRNLYIVGIELEEGDDAQQIFESINSTGEKLTPADLIRNYIMMKLSNDEQESVYYDYWLKLEKIFPESKKLSEYFRFYLAAKNYTLVTEKELYDAFKNYWNKGIQNNSKDDLLSDLLNYALHFERLYLSEDKDELGESIRDFRNIQSYMPAPFMLRVLEHYRQQEIDTQQTSAIINLINTYLVRRYLNDQDTSAISRFFPGFLRNVENQLVTKSFNDMVDICAFYLVNENRGKAAYMPDDVQTRSFLTTANAYSLSNIRWILDKIETYGNPVGVDLSALNIEHIMPQTRSEYWAIISGLNEEDYTNVVNRLGNLTLASASDNSKMKNNDFEYKKQVLSKTKHLKLNADIYSKDKWTVKDIEERTQLLIDEILSLFPYIRSNYHETKEHANRHITLAVGNISAMGYLNEDNTLTVFSGSEVKYSTLPYSTKMKELREDLLEEEIVAFKHGRYIFSEDYTFNSPSAATDFILGGSNNGWDYWRDENGNVIKESLRRAKKK